MLTTTTITQSVQFNASPHDVYDAFMDSEKHAAFTGDAAEIGPNVGDDFTAASGFLTGRPIELMPDERIIQEWRANEECWPPAHYSLLTIELREVDGGTQIDLTHELVPKECEEIISNGWQKFYWDPLRKYLEGA